MKQLRQSLDHDLAMSTEKRKSSLSEWWGRLLTPAMPLEGKKT